MAASSTLSVTQSTNSILNLPSPPMPGPNLDRDPCLTREHFSHQSLGPKFGGDTLNNHRLHMLEDQRENRNKNTKHLSNKENPRNLPRNLILTKESCLEYSLRIHSPRTRARSHHQIQAILWILQHSWSTRIRPEILHYEDGRGV